MIPAAMPAAITSHWMGILNDDGQMFRLIVHIREAADGCLEATMDNLDVGRMDIPLGVSAFQRSALRFHAWPIGGLFEGETTADGQTIDGTWRMDEDVRPLVLRRIQPTPIDGIWAGTLNVQAIRLRLIFYIAASPGGPIATMKSCDQDAAMVPMTSVKLIGSTIVLQADSIGARFEGRLDPDFRAIEGVWTQRDVELPMDLRRIDREDELTPPRPQDPSPPFPYRESEVNFSNPGSGFEIQGTLTVPEGAGPFPAVLLISGSGPLDRDETMHGHRPFLVLADYLTRNGIAVLRADKRGVGGSGGDYHAATTADFAMDAEAGIGFLSARREVDRSKIGLIGHSEGGMIAEMVAARNGDVAFAVLMAAPGVTWWELAGQQARRNAEIYGRNPDEAERRNKELVAVLRNETDETLLRRKLERILSQVDKPQRTVTVSVLAAAWHRYAVGLNPADYLSRVRCPVLALNGEHDMLVEPKSNLEAIRQSLRSGGNTDFEVSELPGLNHLFQTCAGSSGTEYGQLEETFSPTALAKIVEWIGRRCAAS